MKTIITLLLITATSILAAPPSPPPVSAPKTPTVYVSRGEVAPPPAPAGMEIKLAPAPSPTPVMWVNGSALVARVSQPAAAFVPSNPYALRNPFITNYPGNPYGPYFGAEFLVPSNTQATVEFGDTFGGIWTPSLDVGCYPTEENWFVIANWPRHYPLGGFYRLLHLPCAVEAMAATTTSRKFGPVETMAIRGRTVKAQRLLATPKVKLPEGVDVRLYRIVYSR